MSVILSTGKRSLYDITFCLATWSDVHSRGSLSGGFCPGGLCRGVFVLRGSLSGGVCPGGLFCNQSPGSLCPGVSVLEVSVHGSLSWAVSVLGVSVQGDFPDRDYSDRDHPMQLGAAVCVLLECFVVVGSPALAEDLTSHQNKPAK